MTKISPYNYNQLVTEFGSPLFVIDRARLAATVADFIQATKTCRLPVKVNYSVKTNYLPYVVDTIYQLGCQPEVICGFELDIVEKLGLLQPGVIVNGPFKSTGELDRIIRAGCRIQVDNISELERISAICEQQQLDATIALRMTWQDSPWKRFGFVLDSTSYKKSLDVIAANQRIRLIGLSSHMGTCLLQPERYAQLTEKLTNLMITLTDSGLMQPQYINLGGGFPTHEARLSDYSEDEWQVPSAHTIFTAIDKACDTLLAFDPSIEIHVEPGRALIDESIYLLSSIVSKQDNRLVMDAGKNILPSIAVRVHQVTNQTRAESPANFDIFGPLCMGSDCFGNNLSLSGAEVGDVLMINAAGAYSLSQSMQFIRYQPATVALDGKQVKLVRRAQTLENLLSLDVINWNTND